MTVAQTSTLGGLPQTQSILSQLSPPDLAKLVQYLTMEERLELAKLMDLSNPDLWLNDPVGFAYFVARVQILTEGQVAIADSVRKHTVTLCRSANAVGKGFIAAVLGLWYYNHPDETKVILTAPPAGNQRQLKLVWGEVEARLWDIDPLTNRSVVNAKLLRGGQSQALGISRSNRHFFRAYTIPLAGRPAERKAKFSGEHAPRIMFIVDEADAVFSQYPEVLEGIETCMSGGNAKLLGLFNPRSERGPVAELERSGRANVIELDAFSHPNVAWGPRGTDGDGNSIEWIPGAVTRQVTVDRIANWSIPANREELADLATGKTDRRFFVIPDFLNGQVSSDSNQVLKGSQIRKVTKPPLFYMTLGRYGQASERQLIAREWVYRAQQRWQQYMDLHERPPRPDDDGYIRPILGLDVADEGADTNSLCVRWGGFVQEFVGWAGVNPNETAKRAFKYVLESWPAVVNVDGIGVGAGVPARMGEEWERYSKEAEDGTTVQFVKFQKVIVSERAPGTPMLDGVQLGKFGSLRDEINWLVMLWLRDDPTAMLPPGEQLVDQAAAMEWMTKNREVVISPKKELRRLLGYSPDEWDALALTFYRYRSFVIA